MKTLGQIIARIRAHNPKDATTLLHACEFPLMFLGSGAYRNVYEIVGSDLVVKVPLDYQDKRHGRVEFNVWRRIMRSKTKYAELHPFMPTIRHYHNPTGLVVMDKYRTTGLWQKYRKQMNELERIVTKLFNVCDVDLGEGKWDNFGVDANGQLKITDLGYFSEEGV